MAHTANYRGCKEFPKPRNVIFTPQPVRTINPTLSFAQAVKLINSENQQQIPNNQQRNHRDQTSLPPTPPHSNEVQTLNQDFDDIAREVQIMKNHLKIQNFSEIIQQLKEINAQLATKNTVENKRFLFFDLIAQTSSAGISAT